MSCDVLDRANWRECEGCGRLSVMPELRPGFNAECPRCRQILWRMRAAPFSFSIACGLAGVMFYTFSLLAPFLEISAYGRFQLAGIETGPVQLTLQGYEFLGLLVMAVTVLLPGLKLALMLTVLIGIRPRFLPAPLLKFLFRWYKPLKPWAMVDVYLLGFLVAYTRLTAIASVHLDTALFALIGLMVSMAAADAALDPEAVWRALDAKETTHAARRDGAGGDVIGCHACAMVNDGVVRRCIRCHAHLHRRKPDSVNRCWALVIAAACLYVPANMYPVMQITQLAATTPFTIFGGIRELAQYGLWPLALLVFFASITIPVVKLLALVYMLVSTQTASGRHLIGRSRLFRMVDFIGRWSMIDVFMISILVALVRFDRFANITADVGAACFAAVVVLTMFAVECFDPRLMWDVAGNAAPVAAPGAAPGAAPAGAVA